MLVVPLLDLALPAPIALTPICLVNHDIRRASDLGIAGEVLAAADRQMDHRPGCSL